MRSAWKPVFAAMFAAAVLSACQTSQRSERVPIKLEHSEVSFIGDDSFVVNRLTYRPTKRGEIWREDIMGTSKNNLLCNRMPISVVIQTRFDSYRF